MYVFSLSLSLSLSLSTLLYSLSGPRVSLVDSRTNHHHMQCMLLEVSPSITTLHAHACTCTCTCPTCIHVRTLYSIVLQYCNIVSALSERKFLTGDIIIECSTCIITMTFVCTCIRKWLNYLHVAYVVHVH